MVVRITVNVLRAAALLALILGIVFWTGNAKSLVAIHMLLGIIVTLSLWVLGFSMATVKGGNIGLAIGAIVLGLLLIGLGLTQQQVLVGSLHWIIQVIHLIFGLLAIGFGEMIAGRYKRLNVVPTQPARS